jgi:hypothetical protein
MLYNAAENNFAESGVCCLEDAIIRTPLQGVFWHESIIRSLLHEVESVSSRTSQGLKIPRAGIFPNFQVSSSLSSLDAVRTNPSIPSPQNKLKRQSTPPHTPSNTSKDKSIAFVRGVGDKESNMPMDTVLTQKTTGPLTRQSILPFHRRNGS